MRAAAEVTEMVRGWPTIGVVGLKVICSSPLQPLAEVAVGVGVGLADEELVVEEPGLIAESGAEVGG